MSRFFVYFGLLLVAVGLLWPLIEKLGLGRLPGDFVIGRGSFRLYIPLATSLIISVALSMLLWVLRR